MILPPVLSQGLSVIAGSAQERLLWSDQGLIISRATTHELQYIAGS